MIPDRSVAVIIAAYNVAPTIRDAVRSALDQAETAEVVVVDDASSDGTAAVVDDLAREDAVRRGTITAMFVAAAGGGAEGVAA